MAIKARVQHKHDTEENWNKAVNFIPFDGEQILYDPDANHPYTRIKFGDGITTVVNLPFYDEEITPVQVDAICGTIIYNAEEVEL